MTYRPDLPVSNETLEIITSHHSVRDYLQTDVSDADLEAMFIAAQSASTSSNLHAWSAVIVRDEETRAELQKLTDGNLFILGAPVFIVWVADFSRNVALCESTPETLAYQETTLVAALDAAFAAQNAAIAAESLGLGICYVGGIRTKMQGVIDLLGLPEHSFPVFGMTVGHPDPATTAGVKPRLPLKAMVFSEKYDESASLGGADVLEEQHRDYYETQGKSSISWKYATRRRTEDVKLLSGREVNSAVLARQGFPSK